MNPLRHCTSKIAAAALALACLSVASAAPLDAAFDVGLSGVVRGTTVSGSTARSTTESVSFSGPMSVTGRILLDGVNGAPPVLELALDLTHVVGVGSSTGRTYVNSGQAIVHRPLQAMDAVQVTFPFYLPTNPGSARTAVASLTVYYNAATGITVTGSIVAPSF